MVDALTKLGEAARRAREYISPWAYLSPSDVASNLPGGGIPAAVEPYKQGLQKTAEATKAFREGRWGDAARWYGSGMLDTATAGLSALPEGGALTKLAMAMAPAAKQGIRAFHGSPHDFDRFDMSKIGTGEGAQAYGHGLYFAENEGTARSYRDALVNKADPKVTEMWAEVNRLMDASMAAPKGSAERIELAQKANALREEATAYKSPNRGSMYEVRINADPEHFLDWDKPLSEQGGVDRFAKLPEFARPLDQTEAENVLGQRLHQRLANKLGEEGARKTLNEAGIPGIKYLDAGSRGAGDGTRNYVVFDDKLVEIIRKYGWMPGMAIPAAMALEMQQAQEQSAPQM